MHPGTPATLGVHRRAGSLNNRCPDAGHDDPNFRFYEGTVSVANIKSQQKRNRTNELARLRNQSVKSSVRTAIRAFREAAAAGEKEKAAELLVSTSRKLDKAASKGVIHKNQAANKKSALAHALNKI
jgi:small subunit ribosomal protein S20